MSSGSMAFTILLSIICVGLLVMPFYPAWREWRYPTDNEALGVAASLTSDTMYLAGKFRDKILASTSNGQSSRYMVATVLGKDGEHDQRHATAEQLGLPVIAPTSMHSPNVVQCKQPLYAKANLDLPGGGFLSEVLSLGHLHMGPHSHINGWAHADKELVLGEDSVAVRRLSSAQEIDLAQGCQFERIHAPAIRFGRTQLKQIEAKTLEPNLLMSMSDIPHATPWGSNGWHIQGDFRIPADRQIPGSLVVTGFLTIDRGAVIDGSIKAHNGISIGENVAVKGSVTCEGAIHVLANAMVDGPLVSETHLLLCSGVHIGHHGSPTTVSANAIIAEGGVVTHGTVWARQVGVVWGGA